MSDFNKGDFTQQGVDGHVRATLRLNEKRYVELDLTTNENARGCTISGNVHDRLNNLDYPIGSAPSGNIEITENGENINVAPYATATVNVSGGGGIPTMDLTIINYTGDNISADDVSGQTYVIVHSYGLAPLPTIINTNGTYEANALYNYSPSIFGSPEKFYIQFCYMCEDSSFTSGSAENLDNCTFAISNGVVTINVTDPSQPSAATVTLTKVA